MCKIRLKNNCLFEWFKCEPTLTHATEEWKRKTRRKLDKEMEEKDGGGEEMTFLLLPLFLSFLLYIRNLIFPRASSDAKFSFVQSSPLEMPRIVSVVIDKWDLGMSIWNVILFFIFSYFFISFFFGFLIRTFRNSHSLCWIFRRRKYLFSVSLGMQLNGALKVSKEMKMMKLLTPCESQQYILTFTFNQI